MDLSKIKRRWSPRDRRKRVGRGRGSGSGKTSGRGHNGARSRSGWSSRGMVGGALPFWRRLPKRGFSNAPFKTEYSVVNVGRLNVFPEGARVTPEELQEAGVVKQPAPGGIKVLGDGELEHALTVRAHAFSDSAVRKIEEAGGTVEVIEPPRPPERNKMESTEPWVEVEE
ncbi:MAG: 50S ribosomal protein L15 [Candidatus Brocadiia bacterium]